MYLIAAESENASMVLQMTIAIPFVKEHAWIKMIPDRCLI